MTRQRGATMEMKAIHESANIKRSENFHVNPLPPFCQPSHYQLLSSWKAPDIPAINPVRLTRHVNVTIPIWTVIKVNKKTCFSVRTRNCVLTVESCRFIRFFFDIPPPNSITRFRKTTQTFSSRYCYGSHFIQLQHAIILSILST